MRDCLVNLARGSKQRIAHLAVRTGNRELDV